MNFDARRLSVELGLSPDVADRLADRLGYERAMAIAVYAAAMNLDPMRLLEATKGRAPS